MRTSHGPEEMEVNNEILNEAYEAQSRTLIMQQQRLEKSRKQVTDAEEDLKTLYGKLMTDFEEFWVKNHKKRN